MTRFNPAIWNDSRNADEAAFRMGLKPRSVIQMAYTARRRGLEVKRFNAKRVRWPRSKFKVGGTDQD